MAAAQESRVRRKAKLLGFSVRKSRQREHVPNLDNFGAYMLVDDHNCVVLGSKYDANLDDIERFLR